jgi:peptidoglycan/LPS O-acetylase OafA/YrhL
MRVQHTGEAPRVDGYRAHLDGLRALSIGLVLVQHVTGTTRWFAGATGVGLFFALSGYLITGLLLDEHQRTGHVRLGRFYVRRLGRLAPGLVFMLVVGGALAAANGVGSLLGGALPALLYVENYVCILGGGQPDVAFSHTWSLAVEEHFYLIWPVVLLAMRRRWSLRGMLRGTLCLCVLALAWRTLLQGTVHPPDSFFYWDSVSRADSLLYGCAAGIAVRMGWRPGAGHFVAAVAGVGLLLNATPIVSVGVLASTLTGLAGAGLVVGLDLGAGRVVGAVRRLFSVPPARWLGKLSYSIYLWHAVLIAVLTHRIAEGSPVRLVAVAMSLPIAWVSFRFVEQPVRAWVRQVSAQVPARPGLVPAAPEHRTWNAA